MANSYFSFKQFTVRQEKAAFRVTTDSVLLGAWADITAAERIIDVGSGTGLLALMMAQRCEAQITANRGDTLITAPGCKAQISIQRSEAQITAVEPDLPSFEEAQTNVAASPWASRVYLINSTVQDFTAKDGMLFDSVITNPPFFKGSLLNPDLRKAKARHDLTLKPEELIMAADRLLAKEGTIQLVLPFSEGMLFLETAESFGFYCRRILRVKSNPAAAQRRLLMTLGRGPAGTPEDSTLIIESGSRHDYSDEYIALTKDFYLNM